MNSLHILAIDTSCDETSVAISHDEHILANVISSQTELHKKWGGVVPSIAQRAHEERIDLVITEALRRATLKLEDIELFAVTHGPGLAIALEVGIRKIKVLAKRYGKPIVAVNHMVGHIYAVLAKSKTGEAVIDKIDYPALALLVSGGHTEMVLVKDELEFEIIGQTLDDAMGEAYDKVARMLNLGYPGGPIVARLAKEGNPWAYNLPVPMKNSPLLSFSFSGLKTAVMQTTKNIKYKNNDRNLTKEQIVNIAASFQRVAFESIIIKLTAAIKKYKIKQVLLGGGVIANTAFRQAIRQAMKPLGVTVHYPSLQKLCTDNAAMIAVAAYHQFKKDDIVKNPEALDRNPSLSIS